MCNNSPLSCYATPFGVRRVFMQFTYLLQEENAGLVAAQAEAAEATASNTEVSFHKLLLVRSASTLLFLTAL